MALGTTALFGKKKTKQKTAQAAGKNTICFLFAVIGFFFSCTLEDVQKPPPLTDLQKYQSIGAEVAARKWSEDYDCSNFSTRFYQDCHKAGLPCRVRAGKSGGALFSSGDHAWNSVRIDGAWVNWEPQLNAIYTGHTQIKTPLTGDWSNYTREDIVRIIYETVGTYAPRYAIDEYEIDEHWNKLPFIHHYLPESRCLNDDPALHYLLPPLQKELTKNDSGDIFIISQQYICFFFRHNNKYYGMFNLEKNDPAEGRDAARGNADKEMHDTGALPKRLRIDLRYMAK
jgi:hypothetical protein